MRSCRYVIDKINNNWIRYRNFSSLFAFFLILFNLFFRMEQHCRLRICKKDNNGGGGFANSSSGHFHRFATTASWCFTCNKKLKIESKRQLFIKFIFIFIFIRLVWSTRHGKNANWQMHCITIAIDILQYQCIQFNIQMDWWRWKNGTCIICCCCCRPTVSGVYRWDWFTSVSTFWKWTWKFTTA